MSSTDPYSPPQSSLGGLTPAQQQARADGVLVYAGFWPRVAAQLIDVLFFLPFIAIDMLFGGQSRLFSLYAAIPEELLTLYFYIFLVVKYGGTPGKLLMGLRIVHSDGSAVALKAAMLRYSVMWAFGTAMTALTVVGALSMTDQAYMALPYAERSDAIDAQAPMLELVVYLMLAWIVACAAALALSAKRRTLHDFIAGTAVVCK